MASAANSLRLCLRTCRQHTQAFGRQVQVGHVSRRVPVTASLASRRALSVSASRSASLAYEDNEVEKEAKLEFTKNYADPAEYLHDVLSDRELSPEDRAQAQLLLKSWNDLPQNTRSDYREYTRALHSEGAQARRIMKPRPNSFWNEEETDTDLITNEMGEDDFNEDDMLGLAHPNLEEHREYREYARLTVWEMPLLSKLAKPFELPAKDEILRFRYTTYMGEFHPADRKVVVEFCPEDLTDLTEVQVLKLKKLAGPRYNPEKDIIKMSCEQFEHQAQNKRYLGDLIEKMIATAKDPSDTFEDVPLDTRHHKRVVRPKFPKEWLLTEERKQELEAIRREAMELDKAKKEKGELVDGKEIIQVTLSAPAAEAAVERVPVRVSAKGRMGGRR